MGVAFNSKTFKQLDARALGLAHRMACAAAHSDDMSGPFHWTYNATARELFRLASTHMPISRTSARLQRRTSTFPIDHMRSFRAIWPAFLLPYACLAQTGPGGVGSATSNILWFDANQGITITSGAISAWGDRSGNGNHASQVVAAQRPVLASNTLNGYPAVQFDNDQTNYDFLRVPDNSTLEGMNGLTGFVVYHLLTGTAATAPRCFFSKRDGVDTQEAYDWFLWNSGGNVVQHLDIDNTSHRASSSGNYANGTTYVNSFTYHGQTPSDVNDQTLYNGNTAVGNRSEGATSIPNYSSDLYLGILRGHTGTGANVSRFNGYIGEIILYNTVLNEAQRVVVNNYLAARYGIALTSSDVYRQDEPAQGNYDHDVAGIGRTTAAHVQNDSRAGVVQMSNPSGLGDDEFLMWGHDNGTLGTSGVSDVPTGLEGRWQRTWRVSEADRSNNAVDVGSVDIAFDLSSFSGVNATHLRLLVDTDNDGVFNDETGVGGAESIGSGRYRFSGVNALANNLRFTLGTTNIAETPLPVRLLSFSGELANEQASLSWATATERNSDHFRVERSEDMHSWTAVGELPAAGHSEAVLHYTLLDPRSLTSLTYYRLAQVDVDGTTEFSNTIGLRPAPFTEPVLWPNPAREVLHIQLTDGDLRGITVFDLQGRSVLVQSTTSSSTASVDLRSLSEGPYVVVVEHAGGSSQHRVVVSR